MVSERNDNRKAIDLFRDLGELSREQALAIAGDRLQAVAFLTRQIEAKVGELQAFDGQSLLDLLRTDQSLQRELQQFQRWHTVAKQVLRTAILRLGQRRASLARVGMQWYGEERLFRLGHNSLDLSG
ncbi:MAG: hypothetical protein ACUVWR_01875 [Anaerolineae bacterium]